MAAYNEPQPPKDRWVARLYEEHGLTAASTMEEIEPIARRLPSTPATALAGAELVMGRRIDGREHDLAQVYGTPGIDAGTRFGLLLFAKGMEETSGMDKGGQR